MGQKHPKIPFCRKIIKVKKKIFLVNLFVKIWNFWHEKSSKTTNQSDLVSTNKGELYFTDIKKGLSKSTFWDKNSTFLKQRDFLVKSQLDGKNSSHPKMHKYDGICSITKRFLLFLVTTRFWVAILHLLYVFQLVTHPATIKNNRRLSPQTKLDF